jgi:hypothetical protein
VPVSFTIVVFCCPKDFFFFIAMSIFAIFIHCRDNWFYCQLDSRDVVFRGVSWGGWFVG